MYKPPEGYNETHESIGLHVEQSVGEHTYGVQGMTFNDSFGEDSEFYAATYTYDVGATTISFKDKSADIDHKVGLGVGYVSTSYYSGPIVLPVYEIGYGRFSLQNSLSPPAFGSEALFMTQLKIKLYKEKKDD